MHLIRSRQASVVTSTITVANDGPNAAQNAVLLDALPDGVDFVDATSSQGSCTADGQDVTCQLGDLADGDEVTVEVRARVPASSSDISFVNVATISSPTFDPDLDDNGAGFDGRCGQLGQPRGREDGRRQGRSRRARSMPFTVTVVERRARPTRSTTS